MSRVILGLVALSLIPRLVSAQTQTFVIQGPDGAVGVGATQTDVITNGVPVSIGQPPARDGQPVKTGTSQIRGRIVASDNGQPLRRASVRLSSPEIREGRGTTTDADGRYEFRDLPAGRYTVSASKNGYVMISYGQRRPNEPGRPLDLADKQVAEKVDVALPRGGIITGRILDEFGEPVANAMVQPMTIRNFNGERRPMPMGASSTTPDTGEFRLWGLAPGEYFVMVNARGMMMNIGPSDDRTGYLPTYYPGTPNVAEAQPVAIAVGQTASGVDVMLSPARTAQISGTASNSKGQPIRNGSVMAMSRAPNAMMMGPSAMGMIRPDGTFTLSGVPPGEYTLRANAPATPGTPQETLTANVSVGSEDVTGVVLTPTPPIKITGRITLDPASGWLQPSTVRLMVSPKEPGGMFFGPGGMPIVHDDFTFEAPATPGAMMIRAMPMQIGSGPLAWSVKSIRVDNVEVIDSGVELAAGRDLSGVEIVITNRVQVVSGLVTNDGGQIPQDATVLFFAQNPDLRTTGRFTGQGRPDQNGRYTVRNLPPGDYFAVATDYIDPNRRGNDPGYLEDLSRRATRLTLREGETRALDLKIIAP
jgi:hypothetical protein